MNDRPRDRSRMQWRRLRFACCPISALVQELPARCPGRRTPPLTIGCSIHRILHEARTLKAVLDGLAQPDSIGDRDMTRNISRRTFLHGASGIAAASALSGSITAAAIPNAQASSNPNIPPGVKFRGVNLAGNFAQTTAADGNDIWASLWGAWDWSGLIAPQLDDIAKIGNTVRIIGNTLVMALGSITLTQYLARWKQLLDHAQSLGLLVYPCGGDLGHWGIYTWAQSTQTYTQLAQLLKSYPNVIGVDIVNEASQPLQQVGSTYDARTRH